MVERGNGQGGSSDASARLALGWERLDEGRVEEALMLATPLCLDREAWSGAGDLLWDCCVAAGIDPTARAADLARQRMASPAMLCHLIGRAVEPPAMLGELRDLVVAAHESFGVPPGELHPLLGEVVAVLAPLLPSAGGEAG